MKKVHIVLIIIIALGIGSILSTFASSSTYASFTEAIEEPEREFHVVGQLNKEKPLEYNPVENANLFCFYLKDRDGHERKVLFNGTKPQDFERSEQIVVSGKMKNDGFYADKILMKCPSKYNDGKSELTEYTAEQKTTEKTTE